MTRFARAIKAVGYAASSPGLLKHPLIEGIKSVYAEGVLKKSPLPIEPLYSLVPPHTTFQLQNCATRPGNVSAFELQVIAALVAYRQPKNLLEIGTFDGNTTLQLALNAPSDATIHTLDLPPGSSTTLKEESAFVSQSQRKFHGSQVEGKIVEHFCDSTHFDFSTLGPLDFCFIDGSHAYEHVKCDTENVMGNLAPNGFILWHDFTPHWPDVFGYLCALPLIRIADTTLACYIAP